MSTRTLLTLREFMRLPDDDQRHELDEGELNTMPPAKYRHSKIASRVYQLLFGYLLKAAAEKREHGELLMEAGYQLGENTVRQPDVSYIRHGRGEQTDPEGYIQGAPDLAVEIVSPSDTAEEINRKARQYLDAGALLVWVVYAGNQEVYVYRAGSSDVTVLREGDNLNSTELFPGWEQGVIVRDLFAGTH